MRFRWNTSNQGAPQERSVSEANSKPPPWWTGFLTCAQCVGNAASFGVRGRSVRNCYLNFPSQEPSMPAANFIRTPRRRGAYLNVQSVRNAASVGGQYESRSNARVSNNDGNLNLPEQELVSSFSHLEVNQADGNHSNEDPSVSNYLPALFSSVNSKQFSKSDLIELLDSSIDGLKREATKGFRGSTAQINEMIAKIRAQEVVLRYFAREFPKHDYCHIFKRKLTTLKFYIDNITRNIELNIYPTESKKVGLKATSASIEKNIEKLKAWDSRQSFLGGQSEKFANVVCAKDLLPQNEGPLTCGICFSTVEETSDFAVQSECSHIFCTSCITSWYETKENCPICRKSGLFMSKDRLLELRSRSPEPAH